MSMWGDDNWKQQVLDEVDAQIDGLAWLDEHEAAQGLMIIAAHLIDRGPSKTDKIYQQGREDMRQDMLKRISE